MTPAQFTAALAGTRMDPDTASTKAARLVLVDRLSGYEAAHRLGLTEGAVNAKVRKLRAMQPQQPCTRCHGSGHEPE